MNLTEIAGRLHKVLDRYPKAGVGAGENEASWLYDIHITKQEANQLSVYGLKYKKTEDHFGNVYYLFYRKSPAKEKTND